jgi:hypothetical protein
VVLATLLFCAAVSTVFVVIYVRSKPRGTNNPPGFDEGVRRVTESVKFDLPEDTSLDEEQYAAWGIPSCDHSWTEQDLAFTVTKLRDLASTHPDHLPVFGSSKSGRVFAHLVDPTTLGLAQGNDIPVGERATTLAKGYADLTDLMAIYGSPNGPNDSGPVEQTLVELTGAILRSNSALLDTGEQVLDATRNDESRRAIRLGGYKKLVHFGAVNLALVTSVVCQPRSLSGPGGLDSDRRQKLLEYAQAYGPAIAKHLSDSERKSIADAMNIYLDHDRSDPFRPKLVELRDAILNAGPASTQQATTKADGEWQEMAEVPSESLPLVEV